MAGTIKWRVYDQIGPSFIFVGEIDSGTTHVMECSRPQFFRPVFYTDFCFTPGVATYFYTDGSHSTVSPDGIVTNSSAQSMHKRYGFGVNPCTFNGDGGMEFAGGGWSPQCSGSPPGDATHTCSVVLKHSGSGGTVYDSASGSITVTIPECCEDPPPPPDEDPFIITAVAGSGTHNPLTDTATIGNMDNPTGTLTFNFYGPDDDLCGGPPIFTSVIPVAGNGSYISETFFPEDPGTYSVVVSYSGDGNNDPIATLCGDPTETVEIIAGVNPGMSLRAASTGTEIWFRPEDHGQVF